MLNIVTQCQQTIHVHEMQVLETGQVSANQPVHTLKSSHQQIVYTCTLKSSKHEKK